MSLCSFVLLHLPVYTEAMQETIFHKILRKEVPSTTVLETAEVLCFKDIQPQAVTHLLFIPKEHLAIMSIKEAVGEYAHVPSLLIHTARSFAEEHNLSGYKLQFNVGKEGGQEVPYIHLHLLSNQSLHS